MDGSYCLTNEEHGRGDADDPQPVGERQGYDVEEGAAYSHYQYLAYKHHSGYNQELSAVAQEKGRTAGGKSACVEKVPELEHDEDGEEEAEFLRRQSGVGPGYVAMPD